MRRLAIAIIALAAAGCTSGTKPAPAQVCHAGETKLQDVAALPEGAFAVVRLVVAGST